MEKRAKRLDRSPKVKAQAAEVTSEQDFPEGRLLTTESEQETTKGYLEFRRPEGITGTVPFGCYTSVASSEQYADSAAPFGASTMKGGLFGSPTPFGRPVSLQQPQGGGGLGFTAPLNAATKQHSSFGSSAFGVPTNQQKPMLFSGGGFRFGTSTNQGGLFSGSSAKSSKEPQIAERPAIGVKSGLTSVPFGFSGKKVVFSQASFPIGGQSGFGAGLASSGPKPRPTGGFGSSPYMTSLGAPSSSQMGMRPQHGLLPTSLVSTLTDTFSGSRPEALIDENKKLVRLGGHLGKLSMSKTQEMFNLETCVYSLSLMNLASNVQAKPFPPPPPPPSPSQSLPWARRGTADPPPPPAGGAPQPPRPLPLSFPASLPPVKAFSAQAQGKSPPPPPPPPPGGAPLPPPLPPCGAMLQAKPSLPTPPPGGAPLPPPLPLPGAMLQAKPSLPTPPLGGAPPRPLLGKARPLPCSADKATPPLPPLPPAGDMPQATPIPPTLSRRSAPPLQESNEMQPCAVYKSVRRKKSKFMFDFLLLKCLGLLDIGVAFICLCQC